MCVCIYVCMCYYMFMYWENRPKSENWAILTPRSSATVRRTKKSTRSLKLPGLELQRGVNSISLRCITWPVAWSGWSPPSLGFWGQMTSEWKLFINFCPKSAFQVFNHDSRFVAKFGEGCCEVAEKSSDIAYKKNRRRGDVQAPPISPPLSRSRSKCRERCRPLRLELCMCTDFGPDRLLFAGLIPERVQTRAQLVLRWPTGTWRGTFCKTPLKLPSVGGFGPPSNTWSLLSRARCVPKIIPIA